MMEMVLQREPTVDGATLGELFIDGVHQCYTLEDEVRTPGVKVPGATAIPAGRYRVTITQSARFGRMMPLVNDVPGFEGIRIHLGNTAADTEGCLLVGVTKGENTIGQSRMAFEPLFAVLETACACEEVWIDVKDAG